MVAKKRGKVTEKEKKGWQTGIIVGLLWPRGAEVVGGKFTFQEQEAQKENTGTI